MANRFLTFFGLQVRSGDIAAHRDEFGHDERLGDVERTSNRWSSKDLDTIAGRQDDGFAHCVGRDELLEQARKFVSTNR